jgi:hypothetical protein
VASQTTVTSSSPGAVTSVMTPRRWRKRRMRLLGCRACGQGAPHGAPAQGASSRQAEVVAAGRSAGRAIEADKSFGGNLVAPGSGAYYDLQNGCQKIRPRRPHRYS